MRKFTRLSLRFTKVFIFAVLFWTFLFPTVSSYIGYAANYGGPLEQLWLDRAIVHLKWIREDCQDKELASVLDYTIRRYNRIDPFYVSVSRCDWYPFSRDKAIGINNPLVPGVTLDITLLTDYTLHEGACVLVHEALHDYYPWLGHSYVNPMMNRLETQYVYRKTNSSRTRSDSSAANGGNH